ncbi:MAG: hypothetical protein ACK5K7_06745 [Bacilli bacterium]
MFEIGDINRFYGVFKLTQVDLAERLMNYFKDESSIHKKGEYLYVPGNSKVCLVAHLDTVHREVPTRIFKRESNNNTKIYANEGIGADDRCGVIANLVLRDGLVSKPHLLFTYNEEIGGLGAKAFVKSDIFKELQKQLNCFIEFDRKGADDYIDYGNKCKSLEKIFNREGFKTRTGSYSDVSDLSSSGEIAAINLSIGYYRAHTTSEYFIEEEMINNIKKISNIYDELNASKRFIIDIHEVDINYIHGAEEWYDYDFLFHDLNLYDSGYLNEDYFIYKYGEGVESLKYIDVQINLLELDYEEVYQHDLLNFSDGFLSSTYFDEKYKLLQYGGFYEL